MRTITRILKQAGQLPSGFHIHIDNAPWMPLDIEDLRTTGPNGYAAVSVAHYRERNGDRMRDPEMRFEMRREGEDTVLTPYYWRNDYLGIEQYSSYRDDEQTLFVLPGLRQIHSQFSEIWDASLRDEGYPEAFERGG